MYPKYLMLLICIRTSIVYSDNVLTNLVATSGGLVRGEILTTVEKRMKFSSFRGIPYGKPPIGHKRFMPPEVVDPWIGILNATSEATPCPQMDSERPGHYIGLEDCLNLNVYTPKTNLPHYNHKSPLAVMVWFTGGQFHYGYSNITYFGPDYLIENDVVVVVANFRQGVLGFLALNLPGAPGNAALKDQRLVLLWVKQNIHAFGGNPNMVTIFGESTGGASVDFHVLSDASSGLFHRSISMSASPLCAWASAPVNTQKPHAFHLGKLVGIFTDNSQELLDALYDIPAEDLVRATANMHSNLRPFKPTIEDPAISGNSSFLTECSLKKYKSGEFNQLPHMTGYLASEELSFYSDLQALKLAGVNSVHQSLVISADIPSHVQEILSNVTGGLPQFVINDMVERIIQQAITNLTEVLYFSPIDSKQQFIQKYSPVYYYKISIVPDSSRHKFHGLSLLTGAGHGDDLAYLWHTTLFDFSTNKSDPFVITRNRMTRMWTNFAKFSNPTPLGITDQLLKISWPVSGEDGYHLEIDNELTVAPRPLDSITKKIQTAYIPYFEKFSGCT